MSKPLEHGRYYHIYNRGNNYENLFLDGDDYEKFLDFFDIYINSIADTFAWCLMRNHFHLLVRVKEEQEIGFLNSEFARIDDLHLKWKTFFPKSLDTKYKTKPVPSLQFKHLFNTYALWFNAKHNRRGSLFEKNFKRKPINNHRHFKNLVVYIHNNPIKHGYVDHPLQYPWSSYLIIDSDKHTFIKRDEVIRSFNHINDFRDIHNMATDDFYNEISYLIIE